MGSSASCQVEVSETPALPSLCPIAAAPGGISQGAVMWGQGTPVNVAASNHIFMGQKDGSRRMSSEHLCAGSRYCLWNSQLCNLFTPDWVTKGGQQMPATGQDLVLMGEKG